MPHGSPSGAAGSIWLVAVFLIAYRPGFWYPEDLEYLALPVLLLAVNGLVHYRLLSNRPVTQRWPALSSAPWTLP